MSGRRRRVPATPARTVPALLVLLDPDQPGLTDTERLRLRVRNSASVTGRCCGGTASPIRPGEANVVTIPHDHECPAADGQWKPDLEQRLGAHVQYFYVETEVRVA